MVLRIIKIMHFSNTLSLIKSFHIHYCSWYSQPCAVRNSHWTNDTDNFYNWSLKSILIHIIILKPIILFCHISTLFSIHWCHSSWKDAYLDHTQIQNYLPRKKTNGSHLHYKIIFPLYLLLFYLSFLWKRETEPTHSEHFLSVKCYTTHLSVVSFTSPKQSCPLLILLFPFHG